MGTNTAWPESAKHADPLKNSDILAHRFETASPHEFDNTFTLFLKEGNSTTTTTLFTLSFTVDVKAYVILVFPKILQVSSCESQIQLRTFDEKISHKTP